MSTRRKPPHAIANGSATNPRDAGNNNQRCENIGADVSPSDRTILSPPDLFRWENDWRATAKPGLNNSASTDPASVERTTDKLPSQSVVPSTDTGSVEGKANGAPQLVAVQSLHPPARGRWGEVAEVLVRSLLTISIVVSAINAVGCNRKPVEQTSVQLTPSSIRADRRAYDGAPPVIPHKLQTAACKTCHTETGKEIPNMGFAPANPHAGTHFAGAVQNCKQCHVFAGDRKLFAKTSFTGLAQNLRHGERQYAGAPPVMPHGALMRENCRACHTGQAARPEIRCTHPHRTNCRQCHIRSLIPNDETWQSG